METSNSIVSCGVRKLAILFFWLKYVNNFSYLLLLSLFLKKFGSAGLPYVYILVNILFVTSQIILLKFPEEKGYYFIKKIYRLFIPATFFFAVLEFTTQPIWFLIALISLMLFDIHSTQAFADLSNQILPLRDAKQSLSKIYAAGTAGSILSGLCIRFFLDYTTISQAFLIIGAFVLLILRIINGLDELVSKCDSQNNNDLAIDCKMVPIGQKTNLYIKILLFLSFLAVLGKTLVEFAYNTSVAQVSDSTRELASFLGIFGAIVDFVVLLLQTFLASKVFMEIPLGAVMIFRGIGMILLSVLAGLFDIVYLVFVVQFFLLVVTKAFVGPAFSLLLEPIPRIHRSFFRRVVSIVDSLANVAGGVLLFLLIKIFCMSGDNLRLSNLFFGLAVLYGIHVLLSLSLNRCYLDTVRETMDIAEEKGTLEFFHSIRFIPYPERVARVAELLRDRNQDVRLQAIYESGELKAQDAADLLLTSMATEDSLRNLAAACKVLFDRLGKEGAELVEDFLFHEKEPRVLANLIEAIGNIGSSHALGKILEPFLEHSNHRVRGNAIVGIIRWEKDKNLLDKSLDSLLKMVTNFEPIQRATAAVVMGTTCLPIFVPALKTLAQEDSPQVVRNAFISLAKLRTQSAVEFIAKSIHKPGIHGECAREAWKLLSQENYLNLFTLMKNLTINERRTISEWLARVAPDHAFKLAQKIIRIDDGNLRERLIAAVNSFDEATMSVLSKCLLETPDGGIEVDISPIIMELRSSDLSYLPTWAELIPFLGGMKNDTFKQFLKEVFCLCWAEWIAIKRENELEFVETTAVRAEKRKKFFNKLRVCFHLMALGLNDPPKVLEAIGKAGAKDPFLRSIALEFIEGTVEKELWELVAPLLILEIDEEKLNNQINQICGQNAIQLDDVSIMTILRERFL